MKNFHDFSHRLAIVQSVLTVRTLIIVSICLLTVAVAGCSSPALQMEEGAGERALESPAGYPFLVPGLRSPVSAFARGDGEEVYRIALENDRILRQGFSRTGPLNAICDCPDMVCRKHRLHRFERRLQERELAWRRQLGLRLDAMEVSVKSYLKVQGSADGLDFQSYRLLIETLSDERLALLRGEMLRFAESCSEDRAFRAPAGAFFLPYYTAWFRFSRDLSPSLRKEFFTDREELPK